MEECPYTPEQIAEIKVLDAATADMESFVAGLSEDLGWLDILLTTPKALLEDPFTKLGAYALEEADVHPADWMSPGLARAAFVSHLQLFKAFAGSPEMLRGKTADAYRLMDIIGRMAECAGLYDELFAEEDGGEQWSGQVREVREFTWEMPGGLLVHARPVEEDGETLWDFWVQREAFMYCPFSVQIDGDPEGDEDFEKEAWLAYQESVLVLDALYDARWAKLDDEGVRPEEE